jgi:hypothetical protein
MDETDISTVDPDSSCTDLCNNNNNNMKIPSIKGLKNDVDRPQFSQSVIKKHSVGSMHRVETPSAFHLIEQKQVISKSLLDN